DFFSVLRRALEPDRAISVGAPSPLPMACFIPACPVTTPADGTSVSSAAKTAAVPTRFRIPDPPLGAVRHSRSVLRLEQSSFLACGRESFSDGGNQPKDS